MNGLLKECRYCDGKGIINTGAHTVILESCRMCIDGKILSSDGETLAELVRNWIRDNG